MVQDEGREGGKASGAYLSISRASLVSAREVGGLAFAPARARARRCESSSDTSDAELSMGWMDCEVAREKWGRFR